jgi:hypothetical protein
MQINQEKRGFPRNGLEACDIYETRLNIMIIRAGH